MINRIENEILIKIYKQFDFFHFPYSVCIQYHDQTKIENFFVDFFKTKRLLIYFITKLDKKKLIADIVFCVENQCVLIEQMPLEIFNNILLRVRNEEISYLDIDEFGHDVSTLNIDNYKNNIAILNVSIFKDDFDSKEEKEAKTEISSFCSLFHNEIKQNQFVSNTISPIVGYLIRRYYYPTHYFKDSSFFQFDENFQIYEEEMKNLLLSLPEINDFSVIDYNYIYKPLISFLSKNEQIYADIKNHAKERNFEEKDFIKLRGIYANKYASYHLVIHIKSLYLFVMKKFEKDNKYHFRHEIEFCMNHSHRCLNMFYGFLKHNDDIFGFFYEFMSNGSLSSYISLKNNEIDDIFILTTINRIYQGINYLHSNSLIHRDIKPSNILLNHDKIPFLSDFETIRHLDENNSDENNDLTCDIGSQFYQSPEQFQNYSYSFPSDIYSFGLLIYFLYEKRHLKSLYFTSDLSNIENEISTMKCSRNIQSLVESCIKILPNERPTINHIKPFIIKEMNSIDFLFQYFLKNETYFLKPEIIHFFFESMIVHYNENFIDFFDNLIVCTSLSKSKERKSQLYDLKQLQQDLIHIFKNTGNSTKGSKYLDLNDLIKLGDEFYYGINLKKNINMAKKYYELSIQQKNPAAYLKLGYNIYFESDEIKCKNYLELAFQLDISYAFGLGLFYLNCNTIKKDYHLAKIFFEISADHGNEKSLYFLGKLYEKGLGVQQDYFKANEYYELSAEKGFLSAYIGLGNLYLNGYGVQQDYIKAKINYEMAGEYNHSEALNNLGIIYEKGYGVQKDYFRAKQYYELSALQEDSDALNNLGNLYLNGYGVQINYLTAKNYYELAAEQDNASALNNLGDLYLFGKGVKQDYLKAKDYYELSINNNNSDAMNNLGIMYEKGYGVQKDYLRAKHYYELSANLNNSNALNNLGNLYHHGYGVQQNYSTAINYYISSSKLKNSNALNNLGDLYLFGKGVKQDYLKAKDYYELSSKENNSDAMNNLGIMYEKGYGVQKDYFRAKHYYELSANLNNSNALNNLGNLYRNGNGVQQSYLLALKYYELSSKLNNSDSYYYLGLLYEKGFGVQKDYFKANQYYDISANLNNLNAFYKLRIMYEEGFGVQQNYFKSLQYYESSANFDNPEALFKLGELYSNGYIFQIDIEKAIFYLKKCFNIQNGNRAFIDQAGNFLNYGYVNNRYRYRSSNDLGLIYIINYQDINKATEYIKEAAFAEFPFGQNNFGLMNQFYFNNVHNAEYMYERASKHKFALAEYNLGKLKEKEGKIEQSIEHYIKASEFENAPLIFRNIQHFDKRLEISTTFVICLTCMKLSLYFISNSLLDEAKKYFTKSFSKIICNDDAKSSFRFTLHYDHILKDNLSKMNKEKNENNSSIKNQNDKKVSCVKLKENSDVFNYLDLKQSEDAKADLKKNFFDNSSLKKDFAYIKSFIFNYPLFNLMNQPGIDMDLNFESNVNNKNNMIFTDPADLFNFASQNKRIMNILSQEIKDI